MEKMSAGLKDRFTKHNATKFVVESLGDLINDRYFIPWLSQRLNYQSCRLQQIIKIYIQSENHISRHSLLQPLAKTRKFNYYSTDGRSGRDQARISERKYLGQYIEKDRNKKNLHVCPAYGLYTTCLKVT